MPRLSPFDLIYLDGDGRVIQGAELLPGGDFPAFKERAASALVLPLKTMSLSKTLPGDQLVIEVGEQPESQTEPVSNSDNGTIATTESQAEGASKQSEGATFDSEDIFRPKQIAIQWLDDNEEEEETAEPVAEGSDVKAAVMNLEDSRTTSRAKLPLRPDLLLSGRAQDRRRSRRGRIKAPRRNRRAMPRHPHRL